MKLPAKQGIKGSLIRIAITSRPDRFSIFPEKGLVYFTGAFGFTLDLEHKEL